MTEEPNTPGTPPQRISAWTVASVLLLAVIMIAASITFALRRTETEPTIASSAPVTATTAPPPTTGHGFEVPEVDLFGRRVDVPRNPAGQLRDQSASQRQPGDPQWLVAAPAGLGEPGGWQRVYGAVVPFSTSDGPTSIVDGVAGGFARTPQGAALAAAMSVNQVAARPGDRAVVAARMLLTPAEREAFDLRAASGILPAQQPDSVTRTLVAPDAFRIDSYAEDLVVLRLAAHGQRHSDGRRSWQTVTVPMVWHNGDWRVRGSGSQLPTEVVGDLTGWTVWS
ncbi:hypothetical protein [Nocardia sp. CNY236]|uniref:hypothetical protein n=1 Tax=Nocardia sp. CNY236 TaxID=1169152 RepID=UPI000405E191|nr:hypothetical protein [Nocardia sp. CNY236]